MQPEGAPLVRPGETPLEAARRLVVALDDSVLADPGPARDGQDVHRRADGARAHRQTPSGRGHGAVAPSDRQPPRSRRRGRLRSGCPRPDRAALRRPRRRFEPRRHRAHRLERRALGRAGGGAFDVVGGTSWLWARPDMAGAASVLFVDEAGQIVAREGLLDRRGSELVRPARRSAAAGPGDARARTRKEPKRRHSGTSSTGPGRSLRTAACSSRQRTASTPR